MNKYIAFLAISFLASTTQLQALDPFATSEDIEAKLVKLRAKKPESERIKILEDLKTTRIKEEKIASFIFDQRNRFRQAQNIVWDSFHVLLHPQDFGLTETQSETIPDIYKTHLEMEKLKCSPLSSQFGLIEKRVAKEGRVLGVKQETSDLLLSHFVNTIEASVSEFDKLYNSVLINLRENKFTEAKKSLSDLNQKKESLEKVLDGLSPKFYETALRSAVDEEAEKENIATCVYDQSFRFRNAAGTFIWDHFQFLEHPEDFPMPGELESRRANCLKYKKNPLAAIVDQVRNRVKGECLKKRINSSNGKVLFDRMFSYISKAVQEYDASYNEVLDHANNKTSAEDALKNLKEKHEALTTALEDIPHDFHKEAPGQ